MSDGRPPFVVVPGYAPVLGHALARGRPVKPFQQVAGCKGTPSASEGPSGLQLQL